MAPSMSRAAASMGDAIAGEHLDYEQIEAYVDGTIDDAAAAQAHLEVCELCAGEVEDLRGTAQVSPLRAWMWSAATAAVLALVILGVIALRRPKPAPSAPEQPQVVQTAPAQQPPPRVEPVRPEDPSAKLSPSLARTLQQLSEGVISSAALVADLRGSTESVRGREETDGALTVLEPRQLALIWNDLPLDDLKIAALLGTERQQVINLRQAARNRLARRLLRESGKGRRRP